jgi:hypothetical protein
MKALFQVCIGRCTSAAGQRFDGSSSRLSCDQVCLCTDVTVDVSVRAQPSDSLMNSGLQAKPLGMDDCGARGAAEGGPTNTTRRSIPSRRAA